jgi:hypothetical protein
MNQPKIAEIIAGHPDIAEELDSLDTTVESFSHQSYG